MLGALGQCLVGLLGNPGLQLRQCYVHGTVRMCVNRQYIIWLSDSQRIHFDFDTKRPIEQSLCAVKPSSVIKRQIVMTIMG